MEEIKKTVGRPQKAEVPFDAEIVKVFIDRLFSIEREIKVLQEDKKQLREEFNGKINQKTINQCIRLVKIQLDLEKGNNSQETIEEISSLVKDKVAMILT